ncbi:MAG: alpha/beta hydrolase [Cycloclasticus sp.]|nr:alpha/beta hydrolase [Cycloclasticus sp.]MBQ0789562.1 alpha/beta hydrolase [Cycloclasticus sp.]
MASQESDYLRALYQNWTDRMTANPEMDLDGLRALFDEWGKPTMEPEAVSYKSDCIAGVDAVWALPLDADRSKVLIYTHGGGFAVGSSASHRKLAGHMAKALGVTALVLDYRLAPENPFPAQIDDVVAVYKALLATNFKAENITTIGDSAGGNLAVAAVLKFQQLGLPLPASVIAFSPFIDMQVNGATLETNEASDALVKQPLLEAMAGMFLADHAPTDPLANPLYADFSGYPALYINAGSVETLLDDAQRLHALAIEAGVNSTLSIVDGMQHVFPFLAGRAPEADTEIQKIAAWYKAL